jgi:hypothetical protein
MLVTFPHYAHFYIVFITYACLFTPPTFLLPFFMLAGHIMPTNNPYVLFLLLSLGHTSLFKVAHTSNFSLFYFPFYVSLFQKCPVFCLTYK